MMESEHAIFSNPIAPLEDDYVDNDVAEQVPRLSNSDFRRLLMTPRVVKTSTADRTSGGGTAAATETATEDGMKAPADRLDKKKLKKNFYTRSKKTDQTPDVEMTPNYRDRAKERRDGKAVVEEEPESLATTADYRAVAPTTAAGATLAERRRLLIQESKYLGGDMEHTHLVKGLDYALLEKVRMEMTNKEREAEEQLEQALKDAQNAKKGAEEPEENIQFQTVVGRSIYRAAFKFRPPERNELFQPGRMAYRIDLEDEFAEFDVPATVIRSKADCPQLEGHATGLTTNEIVINKLTQILSYLRAGRRQAKKAKMKGKLGREEEQTEKKKLPGADVELFEGVGEYVPDLGRRGDRDKGKDQQQQQSQHHRDRDRDRERDRHGRDRDRYRERDRRDDQAQRDSRAQGHHRQAREAKESGGVTASVRRSYFEKPEEEGEGGGKQDALPTVSEVVRDISKRFERSGEDMTDMDKRKKDDDWERLNKKHETSGYDECYPGFAASYDAMGDSDDEVDFTKMDMGNKKGPVGRWDFETQEEYSSYMSTKEALPKAAFQYGVKMADGRRTRRVGPKDEKAELDRQWQKIQAMMSNKRKAGAGEEGPGTSAAAKVAKF